MIGRSARDGGDERIILDGDKLASQSEYFHFGGARHSPDHRLEAWSADIKGSEYFTIRVRDWKTEQDSDDVIEETDGGVVWSLDPNRSSTSSSTTTIARCRSTCIVSARRKRMTFSSTKRRTQDGLPISMRAPAVASASSPAATMKRRNSG